MTDVRKMKTSKDGVSYKANISGRGLMVIHMREKFKRFQNVVMEHATKAYNYHGKILVHFEE